MKIKKFELFRSTPNVNIDDDMVRVTIDCSRNDYNRYFRNDNFKMLEILDTAIEACRNIDKFHTECFCGYPLQINGKNIDHTMFNRAYDNAYTVLKKIKGVSHEV